MDVWMDRRICGWQSGQMDVWMAEWIDECEDGYVWMDRRMCGWQSGQMDVWINRWMCGQMDRCVDGYVNVWMAEWIDGVDRYVDRCVYGWVDSQRHSKMCPYHPLVLIK